ncbi:LOW QUALITY PROTEIN: testis-expressed protein 2 [Lethenteron reissneri]|uniref:LOW QUALITY PROTEIN: testis-expressed protein 2 n=1 Tax=Lethenteron reissneri TaxID=7753 RepID=UPI002AB7E9D3|nr:LOW QUALITY PROTEIN: testis-expressed protein 2 [Lethenteron reissneri]
MEPEHGEPGYGGSEPTGSQEGRSLHLQHSSRDGSDLLLMDVQDLDESNPCFDEAVFYEDPPPRTRLEHPYSSLPSLPQAQGLEQGVPLGSTWSQLPCSPTPLHGSMRFPELGLRDAKARPVSPPCTLLLGSLSRFPAAESSLVDAEFPSGRCPGKVRKAAATTAPGSPVRQNSGDAPRGSSYLRVPEEVEMRVEGARRRLSVALSKFVAGEESGRGARKLSISLTELTKIMSGHDSDGGESEVEEAMVEVMGGSSGGAVRRRATEDAAKSDSLDCIFKASTGRRDTRQGLHLELQDLPGGGPLLKKSSTFAHERTPQRGPSTPPPRHHHPRRVDTDPGPSEKEEEDPTTTPGPGTRRGDRVPLEALCLLSLLAYTWLIFPLPPLPSGLLLGAAWGFAAAMGSMWLQAGTAGGPRAPGRASSRMGHGLRGRGNVKTPAGPPVHQGWMNEVDAYDPETFHSSALRGVRVELRGATLCLSRTAPGTKDPEPCGSGGSSSRTRMLDIAGCTVRYVRKYCRLVRSKFWRHLVWRGVPLVQAMKWGPLSSYPWLRGPVAVPPAHWRAYYASELSLAPARLAEKRTWSKKYPIVLALRGAASAAGAEGVRSGAVQVAGSEGGAALFLFGRTGREKEEWFQRFLHVSQGADGDHAESHVALTGPCWSNDHGKDAAGPRAPLSYERYMKSFIPVDGPSLPHGTCGSLACASQVGSEVSCINALIGRILWDALTSEQWAQLISSKIQQKLGKIRLPPFLDALELTELDMGKDVLRILRAFPPTLDSQGLWVELDVSYSGSFEMTLETKLNLSKLDKEEAEGGRAAQDLDRRRRSRAKTIEDSEDESSAESSLDGDDGGDGTEAVPGGQAERREATPRTIRAACTRHHGGAAPLLANASGGAQKPAERWRGRGGSPGCSRNTQCAHCSATFTNGYISWLHARGIMGLTLGAEGGDGVGNVYLGAVHVLAAADHLRALRRRCLCGVSDADAASAVPITGAASPSHSADVAAAVGTARWSSPGLLGLLGRLARSDCLRRAAENPLVRRTVAGVSNTPLALTVAVHHCWGTLALNVPPPPSDRIWYGFREPPHLGLRVHPKLGERHVTLAHITDWIEKKLEVEFENNFVIPNMDDLQIPMMHPATDALHSAGVVFAAQAAVGDPVKVPINPRGVSVNASHTTTTTVLTQG